MPYSLISKPLKLSEMFQDKQKQKKVIKAHKPKSLFNVSWIIVASVLVCILLVSILASSQKSTQDLTDFQKAGNADQISIRVGAGVRVAQVNTDGEILETNPSTLKADITLVTTPDTSSICEGNCSTNTELELFDEARVYIQENSTFQINSLNFENNQAEFTVENGRLWVRAPRHGQITLNIHPYAVTLTNRAVADLDILSSQITLNQVSRFATIINTENQSSLQLTARQTVIVERESSATISNIKPRTFQDLTLDNWDIGRMSEERAWLKTQKEQYSGIEFSTSEVNGFLKNWFSFLIISGEERASAKFANLDTLLKEALTNSATLSTTMREFTSEAVTAAESSKQAVTDYLLSRWEKLRYVAPYTLDSEKIQEPEYQVKTKIEETYAIVTGAYDHFQWERIYFLEDLLSEFNTSSALAVLEQYYSTLNKNITKYDTADLNAQLLYLENLFSANTVYIYEDFWDTLFEIEYTTLSQLKPAEATAFGTELIIEKIKQVGYLWLGTDKYDASLVAKTIMGEFTFTQGEQQIKYSFFRDQYDQLVQTDNFVSVIFDENDSIIEKAMNYKSGKTDDYSITEDDIFAMEFYQEYISYLENKPNYYQRPPTVSDVINQLTELGLPVQSSQISSIPGWVEIANQSSTRFDLTGWFLTTDRLENKPTRFALPVQTLSPKKYLVASFDAKSLDLSPNGKILYLYDADDNLRASVNYPSIPKGLTYSLQNEGYYGWTQPTKGTTNDRLILPKGTKVKQLDDIVISEISPLDQYRFAIANVDLNQYKFDVVYDYALNVFSEVGSDAKTLALLGELSTTDSTFSSDKQIYYNESVVKTYFMPVQIVALLKGINPYPNAILDSALTRIFPESLRDIYTVVAMSDESSVKDFVNESIAKGAQDQLKEIFIVHNFTLKNFLALPSRLDAISAQQTYHASYTSETATPGNNTTSLQILEALIRDQLLVHEIYVDVNTFTNCDTADYKSCRVNNAWVLNPEDTSAKIYFSFDYNIDTKKATDVSMQRENYFIAEEKAIVSIRQAIVSTNQFLDNVEEIYAIIVKELGGWSIRLTDSNLQYLSTELKEFSVNNVYISSPDTQIHLSAIYNAVSGTLRQIKFEDGKIFNRPLTKDEFKKLIDTLYLNPEEAEE